MLRRWANDNTLPLVWQLNSDYTLYTAVAQLRATDLQTAVSELNRIYAAQQVFITADAERILVTSGAAVASGAPEQKPADGAPLASPPAALVP
jgi:hypothetical protein